MGSDWQILTPSHNFMLPFSFTSPACPSSFFDARDCCTAHTHSVAPVRMSLPVDTRLSSPCSYRVCISVSPIPAESCPDSKTEDDQKEVCQPRGEAIVSLPVSALALLEALLAGVEELQEDLSLDVDLSDQSDDDDRLIPSGSLSE